jgi:tetratricopeptide (TPR) repeat protein
MGSQKEMLPKAIQLIQRARGEFQKHGHVFYQGRSNCALALTCALYDDDARLNEGTRFAEYAAVDARATTDWECLAKALIAHSRIERKLRRLSRAMELARHAETEAEDHDQGLLCIEAKIAQGEVYFAEGTEEAYSKAIACFRKALSMPDPDVRQQAASHVHLARTHLRLGDRERARLCYEEFRRLERDVQNGFVLVLANEVNRELHPHKDTLLLDATRLPVDGKGLYTSLEDRLRKFLIERALDSKNREKAIAELGISRQTFYTWKKALLGDVDESS